MALTETHTLTDLDLLFDFAKDAQIAAMGYTMAAGMAVDPQVRNVFQRLAAAALQSQEQTRKLLRKLGAAI